MGKTIVITGANKGVGFGLLKNFSLDNPENVVFGSVRDLSRATELQEWCKEHPNCHIIRIVNEEEQTAFDAAKEVEKVTEGKGIDLLIANAGVANAFYMDPLDCPTEKYLDHYKVNALGPIFLARAFKPLLEKKDTKQIVNVSTGAASIGGFNKFQLSAYAQSKAAQNMFTRQLALDLGPKGYTVIAVTPGDVDTDMGRQALPHGAKSLPEDKKQAFWDGVRTIDEAAKMLFELFNNLSVDQHDKFFNVDGTEFPW